MLDLGSGNAFFAAEVAALYNIRVTTVDLHAQSNPGLQVELTTLYMKNMLFLMMLRAMGGAYLQETRLPAQGLVERLCNFRALVEVSRQYSTINIENLDATDLSSKADDSYDHAVSSWLTMYLKEDQQRKMFAELLRVTKIGGEIRIFAGTGLWGGNIPQIFGSDEEIATINKNAKVWKRLKRFDPQAPDHDWGMANLDGCFRVEKVTTLDYWAGW